MSKNTGTRQSAVLCVSIAIALVTAPHQEYMSFAFENETDTLADIVLRWEKLAISFTITE